MEFDVFDKLSDLETKIHLQKEVILNKDAYIQQILDQNSLLRQQIESYLKEIAVLRKSQSSAVVNTTEKDVQTDDVEVAEVKTVESAFAGSEASIADILKQTSDSVTNDSGYVFDQQTGLYFDKNSGYYYDPDNQLFFEPKSGVYYSYDNETQEYSYHSRVSTELSTKFKALLEKARDQPQLPGPSKKSDGRYKDRRRRYSSSSSASTDRRRRTDRRRSRRFSHRRRHRRRSSSSSYSRSSSSSSSPHRSRRRSRDYDSSSSAGRRSSRRHTRRSDRDPASEKSNAACIAATPVVYPPSVRLMVLASNAAGLAVGSVGVITSKEASSGWGCLGRNWHYCPVFDLTQDTDLDEVHCEITFNKSDESYSVRDRKTSSGTYLNGTKLEKTEKKPLSHGDVLRIGANRFLVHIHPGRETCGQCEAAEIKAAIESVASTSTLSNTQNNNEQSVEVSASAPKDSVRRANAEAVKIKYGLKKKSRRSSQQQRTALGVSEKPQYEDRAAKRRALEKAMAAEGQVAVVAAATPSASVLTPIDESNVGARLLAKMGWSKGEGLGREKGGIAEPISAKMRLDQRAGLGFGNTGLGANVISIDSTPSELRHARTLSVTRERYRLIEEKERLSQT